MSQYRFYIFHKDLKQPIRLKYDPEGWDSGGVTRKRDPRWHGVFFEYTTKLRFVKDGRNMVAYFYEQYGIEAELMLIRQRYIKSQRKYRTDYTGRFNLTTLEVSELYAECNIEQSGFLQKFKNRQDIKVNLSSLVTQGGKAITPNTNEVEEIELHSKVIRKLHHSTQAENYQYPAFVNTGHFYQYNTDNEVINEISEKFNLLKAVNATPPIAWLFEIQETGDYQIDLRVELSEVISSNVDNLTTLIGGRKEVEPFIQINDDTPVMFGNMQDHIPGIGLARSTSFRYEDTLTLEVGDRIKIFFEQVNNFTATGALRVWGDAAGNIPSGVESPTYFRITADTLAPATQAPVTLLHEAFARVVESITDEPDSFRSEYYGRTDSEPTAYEADGEGSLRGILNGSLIRGFPLSQKPVITSFKELTEMAQAVDGVGIGLKLEDLKERIYVAPLSAFYKAQRVAQFSFVKEIRKAVATEYYHSSIHAGYDRWNNEQINNLDEFCTKREFILPITQVESTLALRSPIIASGYTIEFVRRDRYIDGTTKDNDRDNDNFIIQLRRADGSLVTDKDEDFAELNNLISPETVYNAKLSVMRNIKRNGRYVRSALFHQNDDFIKMTFGEGNTEFTSRLTTESALLSEKQIKVGDLDRPLWIPEYYFFKIKPTFDQEEAINAEPYGIIEFSSTDKDFKKGYLIESRTDDESDLTEFKVLRANQ